MPKKFIKINKVNGEVVIVNPIRISHINYIEDAIYINMENGYIIKVNRMDNENLIKNLQEIKLIV